MSKKCWVVSVELEALVWAESADEAKRIGVKDIQAEASNLYYPDSHAAPATHVPYGYEMGDEFFRTGEQSITVAEALAMTPEFVAAQKRLEAAMKGGAPLHPS